MSEANTSEVCISAIEAFQILRIKNPFSTLTHTYISYAQGNELLKLKIIMLN